MENIINEFNRMYDEKIKNNKKKNDEAKKQLCGWLHVLY